MPLKLTETQVRATTVPIGMIIVSAGAGTGKTTVLSETVAGKMVAEEKADIRELLVLTFTRKAAAEMSERIAKRLKELASECDDKNESTRLRIAAGYVPDASIETLDAFAKSLLRDHTNETGLDPSFEILTPERNSELGETVALECLERWLSSPPHEKWPDVMREVNVQSWPKILTDLDSHLMTRNVTSIFEVLTGRSGDRETDLGTIVSSIRKQNNSHIQEILNNLLPLLSLFETHLKEMIDDGKKRGKEFAKKGQTALNDLDDIRAWLLSDPLNLNHPVLSSVKKWSTWGSGQRDKSSPHLKSNHTAKLLISHLTGKPKLDIEKSELLLNIVLDSHLLDHRIAFSLALQDFHQSFLDARRKINSLSFTDCEIQALNLLTDHPEVREKCIDRFKYVIVDEYQDINPLQQELIFKLCKPSNDDPDVPSNLYVVGDERQSIYGFRDADYTLLRDLRLELENETGPDSGNRILHENFRSRPEILNFVNQIFRSIWDDNSDIRHTDLKPSFEPYLIEDSTDQPRIELNIIKAPDTRTGRINEAKLIAGRIHELKHAGNLLVHCERDGAHVKRHINWGDCAILIQKTISFPLYEEELTKLGIPCVTESGGGFWDTPEIADIISLLYCLSPASDNLDWAVLLRSPWVGLSDDALLEIASKSNGDIWNSIFNEIELQNKTDRLRFDIFRNWFMSIKTIAGRLPVDQLIDEALKSSGYISRVFADNRGRLIRSNIEKLISFFRRENIGSDLTQAANYLRWLRSGKSQTAQAIVNTSGDEGVVTLGTIHQAKGREWPIVILPDLNAQPPTNPGSEVLWDKYHGLALKRLNPSTGEIESPSGYLEVSKKRKEFNISERLRTLYVALTRAREYLVLSGFITSRKTSNSWLAYLDNALSSNGPELLELPDKNTIDTITYLIPESRDPDSTEGPDPDGAMNIPVTIKRDFRIEFSEQEYQHSLSEPEQDISTSLITKLKSIPDLPKPTAHRYLVTTTEIAMFNKCPRKYAYRALWNVPQKSTVNRDFSFDESDTDDDFLTDRIIESKDYFELPASEWGSLLHELMEKVPFDTDRDTVRSYSIELLENKNISPEIDPGYLTDLVVNTLKLEIFNKIRACDPEKRYREFRLLGYIDEYDTPILGTIDLLVDRGDHFLLIDYKSGIIKDKDFTSAAKRYHLQLAIYEQLVSERFQIPTDQIESHIIFLNPPHDEKVDLPETQFSELRTSLSELYKLSGDMKFPSCPSPEKCTWCDYRDICPDSPINE